MNADGAVATIAALPRGAVVGSSYLHRRRLFGGHSGLYARSYFLPQSSINRSSAFFRASAANSLRSSLRVAGSRL